MSRVERSAVALAPYAQSTANAAVSVERTSRVLGTEPPKSTSMLTAGYYNQPLGSIARRWPMIAGALVAAVAAIASVIVLTRGKADRAEPGSSTTQPLSVARPPASVPAAPPDAANHDCTCRRCCGRCDRC